ncbi:XRE family transcriptional regulator [Kribbella sp. CA-293567]|uniref:XRE family transcriptional regulator n=1 Tax=Kribbella sp. CA-293567 TaxID=3002436 RepID=UPI0022DDA9D9|nr:XRE family transcriptional regulator [Kribbella sp. CA-293567]WBQ06968.1 NB-ARC domain-containing protein [Kribbella sp. CA-293567]
MTGPGLGGLLRAHRLAARLTQEKLAALADLSVEAVRALEAGRRRHPRRSTLEQLAAALGISAAERSRLEQAAARPPAAGPLQQFPPDIADFTGRSDQLAELAGLLTAAARADGISVVVSAIAGMGGVGKTALAVRAGYKCAEAFPDGVLYLNLHGSGAGTPLPPLEALHRLLRGLGAPGDEVPDDVAIAAARYRSVLAGRRVLILFDDAADVDQVKDLLPGTAGSTAVVTSRHGLYGLPGVRHLELAVLPDQDALELLAAVVGSERVQAERESALEIVHRCGGLPLALRIAGTYLSGHPDCTLAQLSGLLADESARLDVLGGSDVGVRATLSLSVAALAAAERPVDRAAAATFPALAMLGSDDFSLRVAAKALQLGIDEAESLLERLVDVHLLETPLPGRYRMHDLICAVGQADAKAQLSPDELAAIEQRVLECYLAMLARVADLTRPRAFIAGWVDPAWSVDAQDQTDAEALLDWLDAERPALLNAVRRAARGSAYERLLAVRVAITANRFVLPRQRWGEWRDLNLAVVDIVGELADPRAEGMVRVDLANALSELDDYARAVPHHRRALELTSLIGDPEFESICLINLSHALERSGQLTEGAAVGRRALELARRNGDTERVSTAYLMIGKVAGRQGDREGQREAFAQATELLRGIDEPRMLEIRLVMVGQSLAESGQFEQALGPLRESLALSRASSDEMAVADALESLSVAWHGLGQYDEALACQAEALEISLAQQLWYREASVRTRRGQTLAELGRAAEAREEWRQALGVYERHGAAAADQVRVLLERS